MSDKTENKRIRVAWICHFAKEEITRLLKEKGVIRKDKKINEFATWINTLIPLFESRTDEVELHVIAPYKYLQKDIEFEHKKVHYHFVNTGIFHSGHHWPRRFFPWDYITNFYASRRKVKKIVTGVWPDLIHLHGAENAYYSSWIFPFIGKYPVLLTVQGFHYLTNKKNTFISKKRVAIEKQLYKIIRHINIRTTFMRDIIRELNSKATLFDFWYPLPTINYNASKVIDKKYDFIYYGRLVKTKGIEDALYAFAKVKEKNPVLLMGIVGGGGEEYLDYLKALCVKLKINNNVKFLGYFSSLSLAQEVVASGKILVLPTCNDIIPYTIIESMFMKLPVIAYKSGGVSDLNKETEVVKLANPGDINKIAEYMELLIYDKKLADELALKGRMKILEMFNNRTIFAEMMYAYRKVIL